MTKQLHKLVSLQSQAKKELAEVKRARSQFISEWTMYLRQLTTLLEEQMAKKNTALASLADTEERWMQQLQTSSREIQKQSGRGLDTVDVDSSDAEHDMDMQDSQVAEAAASEAQRQAVTARSLKQESALMEALRQASKAAAEHEEEYRERTPRRRSGSKAPGDDDKTQSTADKDGSGTVPQGEKAKTPPPQKAQ